MDQQTLVNAAQVLRNNLSWHAFLLPVPPVMIMGIANPNVTAFLAMGWMQVRSKFPAPIGELDEEKAKGHSVLFETLLARTLNGYSDLQEMANCIPIDGRNTGVFGSVCRSHTGFWRVIGLEGRYFTEYVDACIAGKVLQSRRMGNGN